jgi:hypothetical protein
MSKHMTIDLSDPRVRATLGVAKPDLLNKRREVVQLAGDAPDPTGVTGHRGLQATHFLTGAKQEVAVIFGGQLLTVDVYALPGEPVRVQIICPRCHKHSTITSDRKRIVFEPASANPMKARILEVARGAPDGAPELVRIADFGRLSIEAFECAWEIAEDKHVAGRLHTGASLCRLRLIIDGNRAWGV